jgi:uncharacterized protein (TIGR00251 family)
MKIKVKVKPNSKHQKIEETAIGELLICVKSPPIDGKANKELIKLLATKFKVAKSQVTIKSGLGSCYKWIEISN